MTTTTYRVSFERIGRNHDVPNLTTQARSLDELAQRIHGYARGYLASKDFDVDVLSEDGSAGTVAIGWGRFGGATFEAVAS